MLLARVLLALALCSTTGAAGVTMELRGENPVVLVGNSEHFTDYGVICTDENGENISHDVVFGGHIVDVDTPGVYTIEYECRDAKLTRKVIVKEGSWISQVPLGTPVAFVIFLGFMIYVRKSAAKQD